MAQYETENIISFIMFIIVACVIFKLNQLFSTCELTDNCHKLFCLCYILAIAYAVIVLLHYFKVVDDSYKPCMTTLAIILVICLLSCSMYAKQNIDSSKTDDHSKLIVSTCNCLTLSAVILGVLLFSKAMKKSKKTNNVQQSGFLYGGDDESDDETDDESDTDDNFNVTARRFLFGGDHDYSIECKGKKTYNISNEDDRKHLFDVVSSRNPIETEICAKLNDNDSQAYYNIDRPFDKNALFNLVLPKSTYVQERPSCDNNSPYPDDWC